ncbi:MAG: ion channel [Acidiferrobacterales bacterium]
MLFGILLVFATVLIHYEVLRITSGAVTRLAIPPRPRLLVVIFAVFLAHTIEIWIYAVAYFLLGHDFGLGVLGKFGGVFGYQFRDFLYFSTITYTSLGLGDVYPLGDLRLIAGTEALTGLLMIGWSASFTYLAMEKFWGLHRKRRD